jgi:hypothetical protein
MPVQLMLGSLVGVPMEVDKATLHKPDYCRIQLGCRDIEKLPPDAKGILIGDYFYTFAYELDSVVMKGPPVASSLIRNSQRNTSSDVPSPRKPRCDNTTAESSERQNGNSHNARYGKTTVILSLLLMNENLRSKVKKRMIFLSILWLEKTSEKKNKVKHL